jgi:hypothetical protein
MSYSLLGTSKSKNTLSLLRQEAGGEKIDCLEFPKIEEDTGTR